MSAVRPVDLARLGLGAVALARPDLLLRLGGRHERGGEGRAERVVVRVLGARYVLQSGAGLVITQQHDRPGIRAWVRAGDATVDLVHALTMLALAAVRPSHRRLALISAATATAFAAADATGSREGAPTTDPAGGAAR
jgi:hypothetical protein